LDSYDLVYLDGIGHGKIGVEVECVECEIIYLLIVKEKRIMKWLNRELSLEKAFPELRLDERALIGTFVCGSCYDEMLESE